MTSSQVGPAAPGAALALIVTIILRHAWNSISDADATALTGALTTVLTFALHWVLPGVGGG